MENETLKWIAYGIAGFLSLIGFAKLVEMYAARSWKKSDTREELHATNQGKQIDADTKLLENLLKRIDFLETELKDIQKQMLAQAVSSARTEEENKHLKETNTRQEQELLGLREDRRKDANKILSLENEVGRQHKDLVEAKTLINELTRRLDSMNYST